MNISKHLQTPAARKTLLVAGVLGAMIFVLTPEVLTELRQYRLHLLGCAFIWLIACGFLVILSITNSRISTIREHLENQQQALANRLNERFTQLLDTTVEPIEQELKTLEEQQNTVKSSVSKLVEKHSHLVSATSDLKKDARNLTRSLSDYSMELKLLKEMMDVGRVADVEHIAITAALLAGATAGKESLQIPRAQHGHALLMRQLFTDAATNTLIPPSKGFDVLEIGTTREKWWPQMSTSRLAAVCRALKLRLLTVDVDPKGIEAVAEIDDYYPKVVAARTDYGEKFLAAWEGCLPPYIYIDAYDFDHPDHSKERQDRYRQLQGNEISDEACWEMHLACAREFVTKCPPGGVVVFDDAFYDGIKWTGKGKSAVPYMLANGFELVTASETAAVLSRSSA